MEQKRASLSPGRGSLATQSKTIGSGNLVLEQRTPMDYWSSQRRNPCVLVVDDVIDNSYLLQALLESEGYQVEIADSGRAAIAKISASPPDLVLLDVMMPEMNGFEVAQQIRQNQKLSSLPIVLVTGHDSLQLSALETVKVNGLIRKPIDFEEVLTKVESVLTAQK